MTKNGKRIKVIVDEFFPCYSNNTPAYSRAHGKEIWVMILEKAFAKLHGSYERIEWGWAHLTARDLTGAPGYFTNMVPSMEDETLKDKIREAVVNDFIISTATGEDQSKTGSYGNLNKDFGLAPNHAYSMLDIQDVTSA